MDPHPTISEFYTLRGVPYYEYRLRIAYPNSVRAVDILKLREEEGVVAVQARTSMEPGTLALCVFFCDGPEAEGLEHRFLSDNIRRVQERKLGIVAKSAYTDADELWDHIRECFTILETGEDERPFARKGVDGNGTTFLL